MSGSTFNSGTNTVLLIYVMFKFTLRQLELLVSAADAGSVSGAAREHHVSQSGVSLALNELERVLGVRLTVRDRGKGLRLTPAGAGFVREARSLLRQAAEVEASIVAAGTGLSGALRLGCFTGLSPQFLPPLVEEMARRHPTLTPEFIEGLSDELIASVLDGRLDAVLTHSRHTSPECGTVVLQRRWPSVIVADDDPLAQQESVHLEQLANRPMVLLDIVSVRQNLLPLLRDAGLTPRIRYTSTNSETVRAMVARGLGYSILMAGWHSAMSPEGERIVARPISEEVGRSDVVLAVPTGPLPRRLRALAELCHELFPMDGQGTRPNPDPLRPR